MKKGLLFVGILMAAMSTMGRAQTATVQGFCQAGGAKVVTQGMPSTTTVQASYPNCAVKVYVTGTTTLATLNSSAGGAPLANPFVGNADGSWRFWAPTSACYDVILTGGTPLALPAPQTLTGVCGGNTGGGGGGGNVVAAPQFRLPYYSLPGTAATVAGDSGATTDGAGHYTFPSISAGPVMASNLLGLGTQASCTYFGPIFASWMCNGTDISDNGEGGSPYSLRGVTDLNLNMFSYGPGAKGNAENRTTTLFASNGVFATPGIKNVVAHSTDMYGAGDTLFENLQYVASGGVAYSSDQGTEGVYMVVGQPLFQSYFVATVVTGGTGSQSPTFTGVHGCNRPLSGTCYPSPVSNMLDTTTPLATGFLNSPSVAFPGTGSCNTLNFLQQIPTTGGLPTATAWGCKMSANLNPNTEWSNPISQTVALQAGAGSFSVGDLVTVIGSNFQEQSKITAVSGSAGTQTLTLPLSRPNTDVVVFKSQTLFISFDADVPYGNRTAYPGVSIDGTNLIYSVPAYSRMGVISLPIAGSEPETTAGASDPNSAFTLYCGARVTEIASAPRGSTPLVTQLEPNACAWAPGDTVEDPDFPLQKVTGLEIQANQNAPATSFADQHAAVFSINGMGAASTASVLDLQNHAYGLTCSAYNVGTCGGKLSPPNLIGVHTALDGGFFRNYIDGGISPSDAVIRLRNHWPGQTSYTILSDGTWGAFGINSTSTFTITNAGFWVQNGFEASALGTHGFGFFTGSGISNGAAVGFRGQFPTFATYVGLCNDSPFVLNTDLCVSDGVVSGGYTISPNRGINAAAFNNVPLTASGSASSFLAADGAYHAGGSGGWTESAGTTTTNDQVVASKSLNGEYGMVIENTANTAGSDTFIHVCGQVTGTCTEFYAFDSNFGPLNPMVQPRSGYMASQTGLTNGFFLNTETVAPLTFGTNNVKALIIDGSSHASAFQFPMSAPGMTNSGHMNFTAATAPVASCGTVTAGGTDNSFQVTGIASGTTSCSVTFHSAVQQGVCVANLIDLDSAPILISQSGLSTTSVSFSFPNASAFGLVLYAHCF